MAPILLLELIARKTYSTPHSSGGGRGAGIGGGVVAAIIILILIIFSCVSIYEYRKGIFLPPFFPFYDQQLTHPKHPNSAPKPDSQRPSPTARSSKKQPSSHSPSDSLLFAAQNVSPMMTHLRRFRVVVEPCR